MLLTAGSFLHPIIMSTGFVAEFREKLVQWIGSFVTSMVIFSMCWIHRNHFTSCLIPLELDDMFKGSVNMSEHMWNLTPSAGLEPWLTVAVDGHQFVWVELHGSWRYYSLKHHLDLWTGTNSTLTRLFHILWLRLALDVTFCWFQIWELSQDIFLGVIIRNPIWDMGMISCRICLEIVVLIL